MNNANQNEESKGNSSQENLNRSLLNKSLIITGVGTDIGKSALCLALAFLGQKHGLKTCYYKPVQCGPRLEFSGDAEWIQAQFEGGLHCESTYSFNDPVSPHLASSWANIKISSKNILKSAEVLRLSHDLTILEGAGGPAVPINDEGELFTDIFQKLNHQNCWPLLIATHSDLGSINQSYCTWEHLSKRSISILGFVYIHRQAKKSNLTESSQKILNTLTKCPIFGSLDFLTELSENGSNSGSEKQDQIALSLEVMNQWVTSLEKSFLRWIQT